MSFALLGLRVPGIEIAEPGCVAKTFPASGTPSTPCAGQVVPPPHSRVLSP